MQFTVEQIRSVRNNYLEPPYPGFSLDEIFSRRRSTQTKLVRGPNAWSAKGNAQTTEEWVARLVQGSLNKLSESNYDIMLDKLRTREIFSTPDIRNNVVELIFRKALDEPEHSKLYARICFGLAMYEVSLNEPGTRPKSELRNAIVYTAQNEFRQFKSDETITKSYTLDEEEKEYAISQFMRRKRANMRFVGQLFLNDVLSHSTMLVIINITMKEAIDGGFPASENIELLAELLSTVGQRLDQHDKKDLDYHFNLLSNLIKRSDNPYPHRIRFKIMDLIDLRKLEWGSKLKATKVVKTYNTNTSSGGSISKENNRHRPSSPTTWKTHNKLNTSNEDRALSKGRERNTQPSNTPSHQEQLSTPERAAGVKQTGQRSRAVNSLTKPENNNTATSTTTKSTKLTNVSSSKDDLLKSKKADDDVQSSSSEDKEDDNFNDDNDDEDDDMEDKSLSHSPAQTRPASPLSIEPNTTKLSLSSSSSPSTSFPVRNIRSGSDHHTHTRRNKLDEGELANTEPTSPLSSMDNELLSPANRNDEMINSKPRFDLRVRSMFEQWVNDCNNDFIPQWIDEFNDCDQTFSSAEELCSAVAMEIIREACVTTRKDAQREAYSFLIVGLFLTDEEVLNGFAGALAAAVEDGLMEDVPKFAERFMHMLRLTSTEEETNADVYYDAANVLRMAYNKLEYTDECTISLMMSSFWSKVPQPNLDVSEEEQVRLGFPVLYSLCDMHNAKDGVEKLLASLLYAMLQLNITEAGALEELLAYDNQSEFYEKIKHELRELLSGNTTISY